METLRLGTFETNSSTTHAVTVLSKADYDKFVAGLYYLNYDTEKIETTTEMYVQYKKDLTEKNAVANLRDDSSITEILSLDQFVGVLKHLHERKPTSDNELIENAKVVKRFLSDYSYISYYEICQGYEYVTDHKKIGNEEVVAFSYISGC